MTNYEKIRKACIEANKEIMELKFGCRIKFNVSGTWAYAKILHENYAGNFLIEPAPKCTTTIKRKTIKEILGREIQLFDIIFLLKTFEEDQWSNYATLSERWRHPDNLSEQSEECLSFIASLIS